MWRGFPFTAIVILAGLTAIPDEILERARLDGANAFQRFVHIIGPMVRPILMVSLLFSVIFSSYMLQHHLDHHQGRSL